MYRIFFILRIMEKQKVWNLKKIVRKNFGKITKDPYLVYRETELRKTYYLVSRHLQAFKFGANFNIWQNKISYLRNRLITYRKTYLVLLPDCVVKQSILFNCPLTLFEDTHLYPQSRNTFRVSHMKVIVTRSHVLQAVYDIRICM